MKASVFSSGKEGEAGNIRVLSMQPDAVRTENKPLECRVILL
jgi:hypothetical protein